VITAEEKLQFVKNRMTKIENIFYRTMHRPLTPKEQVIFSGDIDDVISALNDFKLTVVEESTHGYPKRMMAVKANKPSMTKMMANAVKIGGGKRKIRI